MLVALCPSDTSSAAPYNTLGLFATRLAARSTFLKHDRLARKGSNSLRSGRSDQLNHNPIKAVLGETSCRHTRSCQDTKARSGPKTCAGNALPQIGSEILPPQLACLFARIYSRAAVSRDTFPVGQKLVTHSRVIGKELQAR